MRLRKFAPSAKMGLLGALVVAGAVTAGGVAFAVANGEPVADGTYRFATKLTMTGIPRVDSAGNVTYYDSACSASLVASQWIVTAGHCFHSAVKSGSYTRVEGPLPAVNGSGVPYQATTATVGRTDMADTDGVVVNVVYVYQSPSNDIALARLAKPVPGVKPLALNAQAPKVGAVLRIAGWGKTAPSDTGPATHLQTGQVKISTLTDYVVKVVGYKPQTTTSACVYDSGAPYFVWRDGRYRLVAVESDGPTCPHSQEETTGRIDTVRTWLLASMKAYRSTSPSPSPTP